MIGANRVRAMLRRACDDAGSINQWAIASHDRTQKDEAGEADVRPDLRSRYRQDVR